ncbi:MAG TPA: VWA domain-containing protein [Blastocatellia bacterium]|nr:VWA domain-containing protein [Blastocatellia bacterium]
MLRANRTSYVVIILLMLASIVAPAAAQQQQRDQDEPIKLKTDLVSVTASVTDREGRAVKSLKADDFVIYEDGARQRIAHFSATEEPFTLMLLLDISGSTRDEIMLIKRAAKNFLSELRPDDRVGVIVFSRDVEMIAEFTDSRDRVQAEIDKVASSNGDGNYRFTANTGTSFYDALYLAVEESPLKQVEGRKAIVCVSDGVDSTSLKKYSDIQTLVEKSEASVYFLKLNTEQATLAGLLKPRSDPDYLNFSQSQINRYFDEFDPEAMERNLPRQTLSEDLRREINEGLYKIADREMRELAERTGGRVYAVHTLMDLAGVYKQVADDLRSQYLIGYYPTNDARDGRWRVIRVEVRAKDATVRARSGYWAK